MSLCVVRCVVYGACMLCVAYGMYTVYILSMYVCDVVVLCVMCAIISC